jgi:hypothetical protein
MRSHNTSSERRDVAGLGTKSLRRALVGVVTGAMAASMILGGAQAASAAGIIDVSSDGVSYSSNYPGALFDPHVAMVPGDSQSKVFYVRNSGNEAGILRITMEDVSASDIDFANALTVSVSTAGFSGAPASISKANPCWELLDGKSIGPGQSVAVTTEVALGDLNGLAGQGATAGMVMRASLSAPAAAPLGSTACSSGPSSDVVALAPAAGAARQLTTLAQPGEAAASTTAQAPEANTQLPTLAVPGSGVTVDPNTWHLYQELLVLLMVLALILGSLSYLVMAWLRRRRTTGGSGA